MPTDPTGRGTSAWVTAIRERRIPATTKLLLMVLTDYLDNADECYPGTARLAPEVGVAPRTVQSLLAALEERKVVDREARPNPTGRGRGITLIRLRYDGLAATFPLIHGPGSSADSAFDDDQTQPDDDQTQNFDVQAHVDGNRTSYGTPSEPSLEPRAKARKGKRPIPDDFSVDDDMRLWASENVPMVNLGWETEQFCDHWRAKGEGKVDWQAAWRQWMRNAVKFGSAAPSPKVANTTAAAAAFEEYKRRREQREAQA